MITILAVPAIVVLLARMGTADLAYHLRAGNAWLETGAVPRVDTYTFGAAGHAWLDQQWGAQVVLAAAFRAGGWHALTLLRMALVIATFGFVLAGCRARGASSRSAALLTLGAFVLSAPNLSLRPQLLAYPLFAASLYLVVDRDRHPRRMWLLPVLAVAWANVHGSFVLAPVLASAAWLDDLGRRRAGTRRTFIIALATAAATLVGPFGPQVWRYALGIGTNDQIRSSITEWQPTSIASPWGLLFFLSALAVGVFLARRSDPTPWSDLSWLAGAFLLALPAIRGIVWWGFTAPVILAALLPRPRRRSGIGSPMINLVAVTTVIALVGALALRDRGIDHSTGTSAGIWQVSQGQVDAVRTALEPGARLLVAQPSASWFEFALPSMPVFIDSRIEIFPPGVWSDYEAVVRGDAGWRGILDDRQIDAVVTDLYTEGLRDRMDEEPGWRRLYADAAGVVFVRSPA